MPNDNPRAIASLTISFGLVAIPVKLFSANVPSERISFHLLRASDGSRLKQQYVAVKDGKAVDRSQMTKGFEFAKDKYVSFSPQELKQLEESTTHSIDIQQFVPLESVDPVYFDATYYLAPDKGGTKPYSLLASALEQSKRCAVGRWVSRGKEHVVVIRPLGEGLALHQLYFEAEVRSMKGLGIERAKVSDAELRLADQLIDQLSAKRFEPHDYVDEFKDRVEAAVQRKVHGKEVSIAEPPPHKPSNVIDLMGALKASLDARGATHPEHATHRAPKRASSARAARARRRP